MRAELGQKGKKNLGYILKQRSSSERPQSRSSSGGCCPLSDAAVPPWVGYNEEEQMKAQILELSAV